MMYEKDEVFTILLETGLIAKVNEKYILNENLIKLLKKDKKYVVSCENYPEEFKGLSDSLIYKKVMERAEIPLMFKRDISYFVRTQTKPAIAVLKKLLQNPDIDYKRFIDTTKKFYASDVAVPGFAKYLTENLWETVYESTKNASKRSRKGII